MRISQSDVGYYEEVVLLKNRATVGGGEASPRLWSVPQKDRLLCIDQGPRRTRRIIGSSMDPPTLRVGRYSTMVSQSLRLRSHVKRTLVDDFASGRERLAWVLRNHPNTLGNRSPSGARTCHAWHTTRGRSATHRASYFESGWGYPLLSARPSRHGVDRIKLP